MTVFVGALEISATPGSARLWTVLAPFSWGAWTVPAGFVSDGASIPFPVNIIFPSWKGRYARAAVLHDYLLSRVGTDPLLQGRPECDRQFRLGMRADGVGILQAYFFYLAVGFFSAVRAWLSAL